MLKKNMVNTHRKDLLTIVVLRPKYSWKTVSKLRLLMPWLLVLSSVTMVMNKENKQLLFFHKERFHPPVSFQYWETKVLRRCKYSSMCFNSLWPSDAIWRPRSGSTLVQVMACRVMAPSHYLNQCWLIISQGKWHSSECNFARDTSANNRWNKVENYAPGT